MRKLKHLILPTLAIACVLPASAIRAPKGVFTVTQPDGTPLSVRQVGDERTHFLLSTDGSLLTQTDEGYFFARVNDKGHVISTNVRAADPELRSELQNKIAWQLTDADFSAIYQKRMALRPRNHDNPLRKNITQAGAPASSTLPQFGLGRCDSPFPNTGDVKALVILVEYKDVSFSTANAHGYFADMLNKDGFSQYGGTGCAAEYFRLNSGNLFRPQFDVFGPVTLKNNRSYYGANMANGDDRGADEMVVEAVKALDSEVDFSQYDMDKDGVLDNVFIFFAGEGEHASGIKDAIWPHAFTLSGTGKSFRIDGVYVNNYGCTSEIFEGHPDGVGTFIHEFSHVIGLPDLYCTDNQGLTCTPDEWSVLDYGPYNNNGRTPPNYSAFERNAMQWSLPVLITESETIELEHIADSNEIRIMQTESPNDFFLFENRQQKGWDKYIPGHGMLVWHIHWDKDVFENNVVNNTRSHQYVHIVKANNIHSHEYNPDVIPGWAWPGTSKATQLTATTKPGLVSWGGVGIDLPITDITEHDGLITFLVDGGSPILTKPNPLPDEEIEKGKDWFIAAWEPVDGATDYLVTVVEKALDSEGGEETCNMGSGSTVTLPEGWTSSVSGGYNTEGNFGLASPSLKLNYNGAWLKSPVYKSDIAMVSFWTKGQNSTGSTLSLTATLDNGQSLDIGTVSPESNSVKEFSLTDIPDKVRQICFIWNKAKGNLALDDIKIVYGNSDSAILDGYDKASSNGQTSLRVEGLDSSKFYSFYVVATDGVNFSKTSKTVNVSLEWTNGVEIVPTVALSVNGRHLAAPENVSIFDLSGAIIARGVTEYDFNAPGLYLIEGNGKTAKIVIR